MFGIRTDLYQYQEGFLSIPGHFVWHKHKVHSEAGLRGDARLCIGLVQVTNVDSACCGCQATGGNRYCDI